MAQVAERYGVTVGAIWRWLKNHELFGATEKVGKYRYLSPWLLKRYLRETARVNVERVGEKPEGYVGLYEATAILGAHYSVVYRAVARGEVAAVRVGHTQYYREADLDTLKASLDDTPPEGWHCVKARANALEADPSTVTRWLRRKGFETRMYRDAQKQVAVHAEASSLDAWERHFVAYKKSAAQTNWDRSDTRGSEHG